MVYPRTRQTVFAEIFFQGAHAHARVDEECIVFGGKVIAVAAAAAAEGYEFYHGFLVISFSGTFVFFRGGEDSHRVAV